MSKNTAIKLKCDLKDIPFNTFKSYCNKNNLDKNEESLNKYIEYKENFHQNTMATKCREANIKYYTLKTYCKRNNLEFNEESLNKYLNKSDKKELSFNELCSAYNVNHNTLRAYCVYHKLKQNEESIQEYLNNKEIPSNNDKTNSLCEKYDLKYKAFTSFCYRNSLEINDESAMKYREYLDNKDNFNFRQACKDNNISYNSAKAYCYEYGLKANRNTMEMLIKLNKFRKHRNIRAGHFFLIECDCGYRGILTLNEIMEHNCCYME